MPPIKSGWVLLGLVTVWVQCLGTDTFGQGGAVAFTPTIGLAPTGETMTVTPAISPDRRYVRLSVNPFFNVVNGFSSFTTPLGAVGGAGGNAVGGGGLGGALGGAGGLGGGGLRAVGFGAAGGNFDAGMNGVIGPAGLDSTVAFSQPGFLGQAGEMRAGALPYGGNFGDGYFARTGTNWIGWNESDYLSPQPRPSAMASTNATSGGRPARAVTKTGSSPRHADAHKSVTRRQKARTSHNTKPKVPSDEEPIVKPKKAS
jgi:hypothetical protein